MKLEIRRFYDLMEAPEVDLPPDPDVDVERIKKLVLSRIRREQRHRFRRLASLVVAATLALTLVGCGGYAAWKQYNSLRAKDVDFGEQKEEPDMQDWSEDNQGMLFTFENAVATNLVGFTCDYQPELEDELLMTAENNSLSIADRLPYMGYTEEELANSNFSEEEMEQIFLSLQRTSGWGVDYQIEMIQSADVAKRTFSLFGEVAVTKNGMLNQWEATWITADVKQYEIGYDEPVDIYHYLLLYHPEQHYLISIAINSRFFNVNILERIAESIEVIETDLISRNSGNAPNQTYNLMPAMG